MRQQLAKAVVWVLRHLHKLVAEKGKEYRWCLSDFEQLCPAYVLEKVRNNEVVDTITNISWLQAIILAQLSSSRALGLPLAIIQRELTPTGEGMGAVQCFVLGSR